MLDNSKMIAGRFANWARYRAAAKQITDALAAGHTVYLTTGRNLTKLTKRNADGVKAVRSGLYIQHGKSWLCYMDRAVSCRIIVQ